MVGVVSSFVSLLTRRPMGCSIVGGQPGTLPDATLDTRHWAPFAEFFYIYIQFYYLAV